MNRVEIIFDRLFEKRRRCIEMKGGDSCWRIGTGGGIRGGGGIEGEGERFFGWDSRIGTGRGGSYFLW